MALHRDYLGVWQAPLDPEAHNFETLQAMLRAAKGGDAPELLPDEFGADSGRQHLPIQREAT